MTKTPSDYAAAVLNLIHHPEVRHATAVRLITSPPTLGDGGGSFQRAIALMIKNHRRWQSDDHRRPIRIQSDPN
ncbi:MAG: hypothetical protein HC919_00640 [Oscillatoriales cyanobacterium SM2_2_1]|nr:hypothetical protein [Oscillatoriales cyanobacterium SM2_2_1]